jgi:glycosyltransferase involved in cell wall biosynthesis
VLENHPSDNRPLVSVVLPTRNRAHTLRRATDSVLNQSYDRLELIVVDDASTDNTVAVVNEINDPRVRYIRLDQSRGGSGARNVGIQQAKGDLIAFQDSDDEWLPEKLTRQWQALAAAAERTGACVCSITYTRSGHTYTTVHGDGEFAAGDALHRIARGAGYGTVTLLVKREVFAQSGGFDERLPRLQDYELTLRIARNWNLVFVPEPLVEAHVGDDSLSSSADKYVRATEIILDEHGDIYRDDRRARSRLVFRAGKYLVLEGRYREALPYFTSAFRANPLNLRALAAVLMVATGTIGLYRKART